MLLLCIISEKLRINIYLQVYCISHENNCAYHFYLKRKKKHKIVYVKFEEILFIYF